MSFPQVRMRRLRRTPAMRSMMTEARLSPSELIYPIFVDENIKEPVPIKSMPSCFRFPVDQVTDEAEQALKQDVKAVLLFGIPSKKDELGTGAYDEKGIVQEAIQKLKSQFGDDLVVIADACLCEYTSHGHCGVIKEGQLLNDSTLELLQKTAVSQAQSGVDIVAPSAMIDGQVKYIRQALDDAGFNQTAIMAYSAKYASSFYGPFRDAAESTPQFGNRKSYQMNHCNSKEAMREIQLDIKEGADIVMVKPALAYLDIISLAKSKFNVPIAAYNVSGEYAMMKAAVQQGWIEEKNGALEILTAIKRSGATLIITYFAKEVKSWLSQQ